MPVLFSSRGVAAVAALAASCCVVLFAGSALCCGLMGIRAKAALQRSAVYQSARKRWDRPIFSQEQRSQMAKPRKWLPPRSSQGSVRARVAELDSCPVKPIVPQSYRGAGAVLADGDETESEYVEMDPYVRKGKNITAEAGRKGPPVRADEVARPVGVVGGCGRGRLSEQYPMPRDSGRRRVFATSVAIYSSAACVASFRVSG